MQLPEQGPAPIPVKALSHASDPQSLPPGHTGWEAVLEQGARHRCPGGLELAGGAGYRTHPALSGRPRTHSPVPLS